MYDNNCNKNYFKNIEPLWIPLFFVAVAVAFAAAIIIAVGTVVVIVLLLLLLLLPPPSSLPLLLHYRKAIQNKRRWHRGRPFTHSILSTAFRMRRHNENRFLCVLLIHSKIPNATQITDSCVKWLHTIAYAIYNAHLFISKSVILAHKINRHTARDRARASNLSYLPPAVVIFPLPMLCVRMGAY